MIERDFENLGEVFDCVDPAQHGDIKNNICETLQRRIDKLESVQRMAQNKNDAAAYKYCVWELKEFGKGIL